MRTIFVILPSSDFEASRPFYEALGFEPQDGISDEQALGFTLEENIWLMLLTGERFSDFIPGDVADPRTGTSVINSIATADQAEVDRLAEAVLAAGGSESTDTVDSDGVYSRSFSDPDGHVWELTWMDMSPQGG